MLKLEPARKSVKMVRNKSEYLLPFPIWEDCCVITDFLCLNSFVILFAHFHSNASVKDHHCGGVVGCNQRKTGKTSLINTEIQNKNKEAAILNHELRALKSDDTRAPWKVLRGKL